MKIGNMLQKINAVVVVDIGSKLTLLNINLGPEAKITALNIINLPSKEKEEIVLQSLRDFIQKNNIQHKNAILKPDLKSLFIKRLQMPVIPESELLEAIKWKLKEEISFDLSKAVIDFLVLKETVNSDGSKVKDIICTVAETQEISPQVLLLKQAGLNCLAIIPLVYGYTKIAGKYFLKDKDEHLGILHIEEDISSITIHTDKKLEFYRELPMSINKLRESLKGTVVSDKGKVELSDNEIDEAIFTVGMPQQGVGYKDKLNSMQIIQMLRPALERLAGEIKRSLVYYKSQFQGGTVKKILMGGLGLRVPNIDKFLAQELSLNIEKISLPQKDIASPNINPEVLSQSYASFGLSLDYRQGINLLPYEFRTEKFETLQKVSLRWIAFIVFLLFALSYVFAKAGINSYQKRLDNARLHLNVLSEVRQAKEKIEAFNNFIMEIRNTEPSLNTILKKISNVAVKDLFFEDFSLNCDSKVLKISGFVKSTNQDNNAILSAFVHEMENSAYFSSAGISSVERIQKDGLDALKFNITFKLK